MMNSMSLSNATDFHELYLTTGTVVSCGVQEGVVGDTVGAQTYQIRTHQGEVKAQLAASCLLVANEGDVCS
ncbi:hypothetical protein, partial [uncultured Shewanella sp.]|uniref:hypothetical protein n=1 Tax=uncultured Shewanella sp. TaxID=173975 RepID=UPI00262C119C